MVPDPPFQSRPTDMLEATVHVSFTAIAAKKLGLVKSIFALVPHRLHCPPLTLTPLLQHSHVHLAIYHHPTSTAGTTFRLPNESRHMILVHLWYNKMCGLNVFEGFRSFQRL